MPTPTPKSWPVAPAPPTPDATRRVLTAATEAVGADLGPELSVDVDPVGGVPVLQGRLPYWADVVRAGHAAARQWALARGDRAGDVVVDVAAQGAEPEAEAAGVLPEVPAPPDEADAVVVGAGICGLVIARELARHGLKVAVLDAGLRIADGTTSWNNGMVHPGHDPEPGTHKARLNVAGNAGWAGLARELGLPFDRAGGMIVAFGDGDLPRLEAFAERARANAVPGAEIISGQAARAHEPRLSRRVSAALWTPSAGSIDPVQACLAMADDIRAHGGTVTLGARAEHVLMESGSAVGVRVRGHEVLAPLVVNAAGVHADRFAATSGARRYSIHARRGTLVLFDPGPDDRYPVSIGPIPGPFSKGGGMTARPDGLTTGGPTAVEQAGRIALPPAADEVDAIKDLGARLLPDFPLDSVVRIGSAVRAATYGEDFVIGAVPGVPGMVDVAGIQSPGVASAPAIATAVVDELRALGYVGEPKPTFTPRTARTRPE